MTYSVEAHLNETGARLIHSADPLYDSFGNLVYAIYEYDTHTIKMRYGVKPIHRRCLLAHEIIHAQYRDHLTRLTYHAAEHRADLEAAHNLIDPYQLDDLQRWKPDSPHAWCIELGVTPHILQVYLQSLRHTQHA